MSAPSRCHTVVRGTVDEELAVSRKYYVASGWPWRDGGPVGNPASIPQVSSKCPASGQQTHADPFCRLVTTHSYLGAWGALGSRSCPAGGIRRGYS
jgi:hypothetical protein